MTPTDGLRLLNIMIHALGLDKPRVRKSYRNHYSADAEHPGCVRLVELGLMMDARRLAHPEDPATFAVTSSGIRALDIYRSATKAKGHLVVQERSCTDDSAFRGLESLGVLRLHDDRSPGIRTWLLAEEFRPAARKRARGA